ncbi:hypothetical protein HZB88_05430 [archaeon]|nr:hypothetical protein [archaeon]
MPIKIIEDIVVLEDEEGVRERIGEAFKKDKIEKASEVPSLILRIDYNLIGMFPSLHEYEIFKREYKGNPFSLILDMRLIAEPRGQTRLTTGLDILTRTKPREYKMIVVYTSMARLDHPMYAELNRNPYVPIFFKTKPDNPQDIGPALKANLDKIINTLNYPPDDFLNQPPDDFLNQPPDDFLNQICAAKDAPSWQTRITALSEYLKKMPEETRAVVSPLNIRFLGKGDASKYADFF